MVDRNIFAKMAMQVINVGNFMLFRITNTD